MGDEESEQNELDEIKSTSRMLVLFLGAMPSIVFVGYTFVLMRLVELLGCSVPDILFTTLSMSLIGDVVLSPFYLYFDAK